MRRRGRSRLLTSALGFQSIPPPSIACFARSTACPYDTASMVSRNPCSVVGTVGLSFLPSRRLIRARHRLGVGSYGSIRYPLYSFMGKHSVARVQARSSSELGLRLAKLRRQAINRKPSNGCLHRALRPVFATGARPRKSPSLETQGVPKTSGFG